ncbi:TetR/AcrR family transcriptional regulator [Nocardia gipuzkoensis]
MSTTRSTYHHGALRDALLAACIKLIEEEGIGTVSLRQVARAAGVTASAPYHHFSDRADLLAALSTQGFEILGANLATARASVPAGSPVRALTVMAEAYLTFAREYPSHFRLMFRPELSQPDRHPDLRAAGDAAFDVLAEATADCVRSGILTEVDANTLAVGWWSLCHGLASISLEGMLDKKVANFQRNGRATTVQTLTIQVVGLFESLIDRSR